MNVMTVWQKILTFGARIAGSANDVCPPFHERSKSPSPREARPLSRRAQLATLSLFLLSVPVSGQTLRNIVLGSAGDEVATSLALGPGDGSVFAAGMTNSSTTGAQFGWVARIDSLGQVLWQRQISLGTGFTASVNVTSGGDPFRVVLSSSVYNGLPAAYDLQWWVLDPADGEVQGAWPASEAGWQVTADAVELGGVVWTAYQNYAVAPAAAMIRRIGVTSMGGMSWFGALEVAVNETWVDLASDELSGQTTGLSIRSDSTWAGTLRLWDENGIEAWAVPLPMDSTEWAGCSVSASGALAVGTRTTSAGSRQAVVRVDPAGNVTLALEIGGSQNVEAEAIGWLDEVNFVAVPFAETMGNGGGEVAVMVYNGFANWQGGATAGTGGREEVEAMLVEPETGVVWAAGRSNGFGAGDWDGWVIRASESPLADAVEEVVLWSADDWVLAVTETEAGTGAGTGRLYPNPCGTGMRVEGMDGWQVGPGAEVWDARGRKVGNWPASGVVDWGPGVYWVRGAGRIARLVVE